jgi:hypothetical protein
MRPGKKEEYLSRQIGYDKELEEKYNVKLEDLSTAKRISILREKCKGQYDKFKGAVYKKRE